MSKKLFEGYTGSFFGGFSHYYIELDNKDYLFKYGDSNIIAIASNDTELTTTIKKEEEYQIFMNRLNEITKDWENTYNNNAILDGTQWGYSWDNHDYSGSNAYPDNYKDLNNLLKEYFK